MYWVPSKKIISGFFEISDTHLCTVIPFKLMGSNFVTQLVQQQVNSSGKRSLWLDSLMKYINAHFNCLFWEIRTIFLIFHWTLSAWTREAIFCFLNSWEYFQLNSECLVSKCHLELYSFSILTFCPHTTHAILLYPQHNIMFLST